MIEMSLSYRELARQFRGMWVWPNMGVKEQVGCVWFGLVIFLAFHCARNVIHHTSLDFRPPPSKRLSADFLNPLQWHSQLQPTGRNSQAPEPLPPLFEARFLVNRD